MIHPFIEGAILGLTLSVLFGPALFALLQTSIHRGFRSGAWLALGISISDVTLVFLCFIGALQILSNDHNRLFFGILSGFLLIGFGIATYNRKIHIKNNQDGVEEKKPGWFTYVLKGFFFKHHQSFCLDFLDGCNSGGNFKLWRKNG